jgi:acylglycerol kinase
MKMFRTIRNNWKKSLFAFCALSYGAKWSYDRYQANQIRQFYCRQASLYGSQTIPSMTPLTRIAVLLNAKANNGKAKSVYDKTIFPLLHLIGLDVRVYRLDTITTPDGLDDLLTNKIDANELSALVIVGGDGTLSELAPHILKSTTLENLPICVVPIGEHASFARSLFPITKKKKLHDDTALLCESVLALFNGTVVKRPLLKITMSNSDEKPM